MGDYTKLIVNAEVRCNRTELENEITDLGLHDSAYHCSGNVESIKEEDGEIQVILVGQTKWGGGQDEFLTWLKPRVVQGNGTRDCFAMQFTEYQDTPICWFMEEVEE